MLYLLGIDIGTSSVKVLLMTSEGRVVASQVKKYPMTSQLGWAEQAPEVWWKATSLAIKRVLTKGKVLISGIKAVGLSGRNE